MNGKREKELEETIYEREGMLQKGSEADVVNC